MVRLFLPVPWFGDLRMSQPTLRHDSDDAGIAAPDAEYLPAIRLIEQYRELEPLTGDQVLSLLEEPLANRIPIMDYLRTNAQIRALSDALANAKVPKTRQLLCDLLGFREAKSAAPQLVRALADPDPDVRFAAADAIGKLFWFGEVPTRSSNRAGRALLRRLVLERDSGVRLWIIASLGSARFQPARPILEALAGNDDEQLQEFVARSLERV